MWNITHFTPGPWRLHPYYETIVIADNPNPGYTKLGKEVFVARNSDRGPTYDCRADIYNMRRIVACFNFCMGYSNAELDRLGLLRVINSEPDKASPGLHVPTPWEVDAIRDCDVLALKGMSYSPFRSRVIVKADSHYDYDFFVTSANCHRIVSCVNFCDGYTNVDLAYMNLADIISHSNRETEIY